MIDPIKLFLCALLGCALLIFSCWVQPHSVRMRWQEFGVNSERSTGNSTITSYIRCCSKLEGLIESFALRVPFRILLSILLIVLIPLKLISHAIFKSLVLTVCFYRLLLFNDKFDFHEKQDVIKNNLQQLSKKEIVAKKSKLKFIYVRHSESVWNSIFNNSSLRHSIRNSFIVYISEMVKLFAVDSDLIDSPLSQQGVCSAINLAKAMNDETGALGSALAGDKNYVVITSNLRRTMQTLTYAISNKSTKDIYVMSDLQESTRNVDGWTYAEKCVQTPKPLIARHLALPKDAIFHKIDWTHSSGNCHPRESVAERCRRFLDKAFTLASENETQTVLVFGHSHYLQTLFQLYGGHYDSEILEQVIRLKLDHCSVLNFEIALIEHGNTKEYTVVEPSVKLLHGRFLNRRRQTKRHLKVR